MADLSDTICSLALWSAAVLRRFPRDSKEAGRTMLSNAFHPVRIACFQNYRLQFRFGRRVLRGFAQRCSKTLQMIGKDFRIEQGKHPNIFEKPIKFRFNLGVNTVIVSKCSR